MPLGIPLLSLLLSALPQEAQSPAAPAIEKDPATIYVVSVNDRKLTLADALAVFNASHTGHGALVRGEGPLRELCGRMIERELFLAEAETLGLPEDPIVTRSAEDYERTLLVDDFWKKELTEKVKVTNEEIDAFYAKTDVALKITLIQTDKREECEALRARVEKGEDMSALATASSTHESRSFAGKLPYVRRGDLDPLLEKPLFALEQPGSLTTVTQVAKGFAFARMDERAVNPDRLPHDVAVPQIRKILFDRAEDAQRAALEKTLEETGAIWLDEAAFAPEKVFGSDDGKQVIARSAGNELSLAEVRDALDLEALRTVEPEKVTGAARQVTREWAYGRAIWKLRGGESAFSDPELARKLSGFKRDMTLSLLFDRYVYPKELPTEAQLREYYEKNKESGFTRPGERRLACIVSATKEDSEKLLARVRAGEDFEALAKQASLDRTSAMHGGRIGWIKPGDILSEVETRVFPLPNGSIEGPIETPQGWFLVRVIDRKEPVVVPFEVARQTAQTRLVKQGQQEAYVKWSKALRDRAEVRFDEAGLREAVGWLDRQPAPEKKPVDPSSPHAKDAPAGAPGKVEKP